VYAGYCGAWDNAGYRLAELPAGWVRQGTGNGILFGNVAGGTIEYSTAFNNGARNDYTDGPVGIMVFDSTGILIQQNTSYANKTSVNDGNGFSLDRNTSNSILQNNWSWDNWGVGLYLAQNTDEPHHYGNTVRYNSSSNDGRRGGYAGLSVWGKVRDAEVYGNKVVMGPSTTGRPMAASLSNYYLPGMYISNLSVHDNVFQTTGNVPVVSAEKAVLQGSTSIVFSNNSYSAQYFSVMWADRWYSSLGAWKLATGQEQ
jgi:hypothetical protein